MTMAWRVGMKCELVDDDWTPRRVPLQYPVKGQVYVVRTVDISALSGRVGLRLQGIKNRRHPRIGAEYGFLASRFRPIVDRKTDISFAHEILRTVTKDAPIDPAFERAWAEADPSRLPEYVRGRG